MKVYELVGFFLLGVSMVVYLSAKLAWVKANKAN